MLLRFLPLLLCVAAWAQSPPRATSRFLDAEVPLNTDSNSPLWRDAGRASIERGPMGESLNGRTTEVRLRWSERNLYVLFICTYQQMYLKPQPESRTETNKLWEWDVAEVFVGGDFEKYWQYREYQVSPQGEWVDLDIDRKTPKPEGGWGWNSGFQVAARHDEKSKTWYGAMKIPFESIDQRTPKPGLEYRINFYRIEGAPPNRILMAWSPTGARNYHVPEKFGLLRLEK